MERNESGGKSLGREKSEGCGECEGTEQGRTSGARSNDGDIVTSATQHDGNACLTLPAETHNKTHHNPAFLARAPDNSIGNARSTGRASTHSIWGHMHLRGGVVEDTTTVIAPPLPTLPDPHKDPTSKESVTSSIPLRTRDSGQLPSSCVLQASSGPVQETELIELSCLVWRTKTHKGVETSRRIRRGTTMRATQHGDCRQRGMSARDARPSGQRHASPQASKRGRIVVFDPIAPNDFSQRKRVQRANRVLL